MSGELPRRASPSLAFPGLGVVFEDYAVVWSDGSSWTRPDPVEVGHPSVVLAEGDLPPTQSTGQTVESTLAGDLPSTQSTGQTVESTLAGDLPPTQSTGESPESEVDRSKIYATSRPSP